MSNIAGVQVEKVGSAVVSFDDCQAFRSKKRVRFFAREDRKQERQVRIVRVQQIQLAKVQRVVARHDGEIGVQLIVGFGKQIAVRIREDTGELAHELL